MKCLGRVVADMSNPYTPATLGRCMLKVRNCTANALVRDIASVLCRYCEISPRFHRSSRYKNKHGVNAIAT
eukprot:2052160-Pyramimonas_sp.AAC.1